MTEIEIMEQNLKREVAEFQRKNGKPRQPRRHHNIAVKGNDKTFDIKTTGKTVIDNHTVFPFKQNDEVLHLKTSFFEDKMKQANAVEVVETAYNNAFGSIPRIQVHTIESREMLNGRQIFAELKVNLPKENDKRHIFAAEFDGLCKRLDISMQFKMISGEEANQINAKHRSNAINLANSGLAGYQKRERQKRQPRNPFK